MFSSVDIRPFRTGHLGFFYLDCSKQYHAVLNGNAYSDLSAFMLHRGLW